MNVKKYAAPDGALFLSLMKLQRYRAAGANGEVMERFFRLKKIALPLAIVSACLLGYVLNSQSGIFREFEAALVRFNGCCWFALPSGAALFFF